MLTYANSGGHAYLPPLLSPPMRRVRGNSRGLSEIIGTLMLILIVVAAATALSVFVTGYEKQVLSQEASTHEKSLESYAIFGISIPETVNVSTATPTPVGYYVFNVASTSVENSAVTAILINDQPALWYCVAPPTAVVAANSSCTGAGPKGLGGTWVSWGNSTRFLPSQEYKIIVNYDDAQGLLNDGCNAFNVTNVTLTNPSSLPPPCPVVSETQWNQGDTITATGALRIDLYTLYDNTFTQSVLPPVSIAAVADLNLPSSSTFVTVLDGELSTQPGGNNNSIVSWYWHVTNRTGPANTPTGLLNGEEIPVNNSLWSPTPGGNYTIELTVVDDAGLYDSDSIYWTAPT